MLSKGVVTVISMSREIEIYNFKLIDLNLKENIIRFEIYCSKGTYIRTVCEQIAEKLSTVGYMKELERTMVGNFSIENSITLEELKENFTNVQYINSKVITIENFFGNSLKICLNDKQMNMFLNGVLISNNLVDGIIRVYNESNNFIGIGINEKSKLKRKIIVS